MAKKRAQDSMRNAGTWPEKRLLEESESGGVSGPRFGFYFGQGPTVRTGSRAAPIDATKRVAA